MWITSAPVEEGTRIDKLIRTRDIQNKLMYNQQTDTNTHTKHPWRNTETTAVQLIMLIKSHAMEVNMQLKPTQIYIYILTEC